MTSVRDSLSGENAEVVSPTIETVTLDSSGQIGFKFEKGHSKKGSDASDLSTKSDSPNAVRKDISDFAHKSSEELDRNKYDPFADSSIYITPNKGAKVLDSPTSSSEKLNFQDKPSVEELLPEKESKNTEEKSNSTSPDSFVLIAKQDNNIDENIPISEKVESPQSEAKKNDFETFPSQAVNPELKSAPQNLIVNTPDEVSVKITSESNAAKVPEEVNKDAALPSEVKESPQTIDKHGKHSHADEEPLGFRVRVAERYDELIAEMLHGTDIKDKQYEKQKVEVQAQEDKKKPEDLYPDLGVQHEKKETPKVEPEKKSQPADTTTPEKQNKPEREDVKEKPKVETKVEYVAPVAPAAIQKGEYAVDPLAILIPVADLVYWRDPKISGGVFGAGLVLLFALAQCSFISVFAYLLLTVLFATFAFRLYKSILQTIQKTGDGHPFKEYLEADLNISQDKARQSADLVVQKINCTSQYLRHVLLVEDYVDSVKFGLVLWLLTYVGSWFNGLTLIILGYVALFTLPKVYETNQATIDGHLQLVKSKYDEISSKVRAAIPIGKKKEQ